jgi:hypothetical protein
MMDGRLHALKCSMHTARRTAANLAAAHCTRPMRHRPGPKAAASKGSTLWNGACLQCTGSLPSSRRPVCIPSHTSGDVFSHAERRKAIETVIPALPFSTLESVTREISKACVSQRSLPVPKPNCHQLLEVALEFWLIGFNRIEISQFVALAYRLSVRIEGNVLPLSSLATAD